ncbi:hypothetical protein MUK42_28987 [Musa troglodytarum]|uniref:Transmembrane protein n=1 Tax=Musa troglodytarum TaxID=320322 RepID=A0A9E7G7G6_9LILI|nr:hypothetical protein MUK42_28987 [Musa troglodytarum]
MVPNEEKEREVKKRGQVSGDVNCSTASSSVNFVTAATSCCCCCFTRCSVMCCGMRELVSSFILALDWNYLWSFLLVILRT